MASDSAKRSNSLSADRKRSSIQMKGSFSGDNSYNGKIPVKQILTAPSQSHSRMNFGGQMFLCIMGSLISIAICIWSAAFSHESGWRRVVFSGGAAVCAVMFTFLVVMTIRRARNPPEPEPLPDLSQRRSTIGARVSKKSISAAGLGNTDDSPSQVLVVGDKTRPSLTIG
ncbi:unnamed protein product [Auanema sp. JU1783]|nr:unnamed protein product [Auanema sp. JU1783]